MFREPLPIDAVIPQVIDALTARKAVVLEAPPGSGKTTRIPPACLSAPFSANGEVIVLEPRRLAAKLAARRVAEEMGEEVGATVGYLFRFETVESAKTRLRFMTEGMFLRRMLGDPTLARTSVVIVDEFHERHLQGDVALGLIRRLQEGARPDLKAVVMSATLDGDAVANYFDCPVVRAEGRRYPVDIHYRRPVTGEALEDQVGNALAGLPDTGDTLVFLPGVGEIRRTQETLERRFRDLLVLPLYADLSREDQDRAVRPATRRKVVLATNVAETSITIPGVTGVIDSGIARIPSHNPWAGLPVLRLSRISQASATQRAGRAGRTAPGICVRLYGQDEFAGRSAYELPEIRRLDLAQPFLELKALGIEDLTAFPWFDAPPEAAAAGARELLYKLGALDTEGCLTELGRRMASIPAHPRLARLVIEAERKGIAYGGCTIAAWLGERTTADLDNEIGGLLEKLQELERRGKQPIGWRNVDMARRQLYRALTKRDRPREDEDVDEDAIRRAALAGFPDRVGRLRAVGKTLSRNRSGESVEVVLSGGGSARLLDPHLPRDVEWVVALDAEERAQGGLKGDTRLRLVGAIQPDWLLDLDPLTVEETVEPIWDEQRKRAQVVAKMIYDKLVISESTGDLSSPAYRARAEELLCVKVREKGLTAFCDVKALADYMARLDFARQYAPAGKLPEWDADAETHFLTELCAGKTSFKEVTESNPFELLQYSLPPDVRNLLDRLAPAALTLSGGRRLKIHYEPGKPPWTESRLQDFFGLREGPRVGGGAVAVVLHLLAPNKRAVQVTSDLAGFWERNYPSLRKELGRRYPRHSWPEDPLTAEPPKPGRLR